MLLWYKEIFLLNVSVLNLKDIIIVEVKRDPAHENHCVVTIISDSIPFKIESLAATIDSVKKIDTNNLPIFPALIIFLQLI